MVSSRCVAGLSTGMRAFSARATMTSAASASPSETRRLPCVSMKLAISESCVEPASSASVKAIISMAGSASEANIISRLEPMPPKLVPTSMPQSARKKRAEPMSAVMAMRSAVQLNCRPRGEGRDERRRHPGGGEDHVGRAAEQPRGVLRQHHLLADEAQQIAIGLQDAAARASAGGAPLPCACSRGAAAPAAAPAPSAIPAR